LFEKRIIESEKQKRGATNQLKMNSNEFRIAAKQLVDYICDYIDNIRDRPVLPSVQPFYIRDLVPDTAPEDGESWEQVFADIERVIMPGMTHWHSPRFHAYFPTANSYPAILADMLSGALACIGFTWIASPACTELEMQMMDWFAKMLELPSFYLFSTGGNGGGVIQGTASEATLVALLGARNKIMGKYKDDKTILSKLVAYASEQSHSSVERAALLGAVKIRLLPPDETLSLRGDTLANQIEKDKSSGLIPFFVVATLGTTNSFNKLNKLLSCIGEKYDIWLHIDAAYAGSSFICPEFRHYLNGVEYSDSFNLNPHKWLLVNFDCSPMWVKNHHYIVDAFNVNPVYLRHNKQGMIPDYRQVWLAHQFKYMVSQDSRFEITHPVILGLICFRIKGTNELNEAFVNLVNERKKIHLTPAKIGDLFVIRFAVCARTTELADIEYSWREISQVASMVLKSEKI
ncbi:Aromatic-L-amino-acid decarboxylase-like protein, partial [Dinothrombium tinctorium]